jgi:hypothetical protein
MGRPAHDTSDRLKGVPTVPRHLLGRPSLDTKPAVRAAENKRRHSHQMAHSEVAPLIDLKVRVTTDHAHVRREAL